MAKQTQKQFRNKLDKIFKTIVDQKKFEPCYRIAHNTLSNRVFVEGKWSTGKRIGTYSTEAGYFSDKDMPRKFKGGYTGKTGNKVFLNGNPHTSKYFKRGYKQVRADQGLNQSFVDLNLTGNLSRDFTSSFRRRKKNIWTSSVRRGINVLKHEGLTEKYEKKGPKIFKHTKEEMTEMGKCLGLKVRQQHG